MRVWRCSARIHAREILAQAEPTIRSRGENNPTRRALIRACVPTNAVTTEDLRGCSNTCVSRPYARVPPVRPLPPSSCYCCDLMKCYARSPAITFPLHRLTPHSTGFASRDGTVGHLSSLTIPEATTSIEDSCTLLKAADCTMPIRESLINFQVALCA